MYSAMRWREGRKASVHLNQAAALEQRSWRSGGIISGDLKVRNELISHLSDGPVLDADLLASIFVPQSCVHHAAQQSCHFNLAARTRYMYVGVGIVASPIKPRSAGMHPAKASFPALWSGTREASFHHIG